MVWQPNYRNCNTLKSSLERLEKKNLLVQNGLYLAVSVLWGNGLGLQILMLLARSQSWFRNGVEEFRN